MAEINQKQEIALAALASGNTRAEAAALANVTEATIYNWLNEESFADRLKQTQRRMFENAVSELQAASLDAISALRRNLTCGEPRAENAAATAILNNCYRLTEQVALLERLETLEKAVEEKTYEIKKSDWQN